MIPVLKVFQDQALILAVILALKVIPIVMMKTTTVDVIGMEEIVVAMMLIHNIAQLVNV